MERAEVSAETHEREPNFTQVILLIGPEGSGKTTQAQYLSLAGNIPSLTIGDLVRAAAYNPTSRYHDETSRALAEDRYPDGTTVFALAKEAFATRDFAQGVVLDGYLRVPEQAEQLAELLKEGDLDLPVRMIYLDVSDDACLERLAARGRPGDTQEGNKKRLAQFHAGLAERIATVEKKYGKVLTIDGKGSREEIHQKILKALT